MGAKRITSRKLGRWKVGNKLALRGRIPVPQATVKGVGFDDAIESKGSEFKLKYPERATLIDRVVAEFKDRNRAGQFRDWYDTMEEFIDAVKRPEPRRYRRGKRTGDKR